jgi:hypothetical protein
LINVACLHEFADALPIQVSYLANGKSENLSLRLPIVLTKFVEPVLLDATGFFGLWKKLAGPPYGTALLAALSFVAPRLTVVMGVARVSRTPKCVQGWRNDRYARHYPRAQFGTSRGRSVGH